MSRTSVIALFILCCWEYSAAQESDGVFIPYTLLAEQELDEYKAELIDEYGWSESNAEEFVRGESRVRFEFTDDDIRRAFPEIGPNDQRGSLCSNSMMSGETSLVYLSPASEHSVTVKSSRCYPAEGGLMCSPLSMYETYFFETPEIRFTLDDDVSLEEANEILTMFRDHGIDGLPEWYQLQRFGYHDVRRIGRMGIWYVLYLGEFYCRGCTATFKVVVDASEGAEPVLVLDAEPEGLCI